MRSYLSQKALSLVPVLFGITLLAFILGLLSPGDPAEIALNQGGMYAPSEEQIMEMRERMGLLEPLPVQYISWVKNLFQGDLGTSYSSQEAISDELLRRIPVTVKLAFYAMIIACLGGILLGLLAAMHKDRFLDNLIMSFTNILLSFPGFWLALLLILLFSEVLGILPTSGFGGPRHMIMPSLVLSYATTATTARLTRSALIAEFGKHYFLAATARGLSKNQLLVRHALPNAILPVITLLGNYIGGILGGSVIVETIFALPGLGSYAIDAVYARDYPAIQAYVLVTGFIFVGITLLVDLASLLLNPKIRLGGGEK